MPTKIKARQYMVGFQCLGPDCPDTCCQAWRIDITKQDYHRLAKVIGSKRLEETSKILPKEKQSSQAYAYFKHDDQPVSACLHLKEGSCGLQQEFGPKALSTVCDVFPRRLLKRAQFEELGGELSCPEVTRRILEQDTPFQLQDIPQDQLSTNLKAVESYRDATSIYGSHLDDVQDALQSLIDQPYPADHRLYLILYLARRISPFYHRNAQVEVAQRVKKTIQRCLEPRHITRCAKLVDSPVPFNQRCLAVLYNLLSAPQPKRSHARLNLIIADTLHNLKRSESEGNSQNLEPEDLTALYETYKQRKRHIQPLVANHLQDLTDKIMKHHFLQNFFWESDSLFEYARDFVVIYGLIRFLIIGHPYLNPESDPSKEAIPERFNIVARDVVQACMRYLSRDPSTFKVIRESMERMQFGDMEECLALMTL